MSPAQGEVVKPQNEDIQGTYEVIDETIERKHQIMDGNVSEPGVQIDTRSPLNQTPQVETSTIKQPKPLGVAKTQIKNQTDQENKGLAGKITHIIRNETLKWTEGYQPSSQGLSQLFKRVDQIKKKEEEA